MSWRRIIETMNASPESTQPGFDLPALAAEDHVCPECAMSYADVSVECAVEEIGGLADRVGDAVAAVPDAARRHRPDTGRWSVAEYVCHVRDVFATFTIRLYRARTEEEPAVEPMLNDLRARRFRYNELELDGVLDELGANAAGFCDEIGRCRPGDWERVVSRLPDERRTARWLVRQAAHEGRHHLEDIRRTGTAVSGEQG